MSTVIKRNDTLKYILEYWNHNNPSNIGAGRLNRTLNSEDIYVYTKCYGRQDLKLFNLKISTKIDGIDIYEDLIQYSIEPTCNVSFKMLYNKHQTRVYSKLLEIVTQWFQDNKDEIKIQLHYLNWFNNLEIVKMELEPLKSLLETYIYNNEESEILYDKIYNDYIG